MSNTNNKPLQTLRDGAIKVTIWRNDRESGAFYNAELSRTYKDEQGNFCDAHSFSGSELLRAARLMHIAYDEIAIYRTQDASGDGSGS